MPPKIAITTSSFGREDSLPLKLLAKTKFELVMNPFARTLKEDETIQLVKECAGVIAGTENYDRAVLQQLSQLKVISRCGVGMDNVDVKIAQDKKIKVFNTPDAPTQAVAELVIGLALNLFRQVSLMDREIRQGVWRKRMGLQLAGKKLGIIGFGRIGQAVAKLAKALGVKVFYYDPYVKKSPIAGVKALQLQELLKEMDIISVHLPYTDETKDFLSEKEFKLMVPNIFLINCSRGGIVNEIQLYSALKRGRLAGAAVDVFDQEPYQGPLKELPNVILTPHIGSYAKEARVKMELEAVENLIKGLKVR